MTQRRSPFAPAKAGASTPFIPTRDPGLHRGKKKTQRLPPHTLTEKAIVQWTITRSVATRRKAPDKRPSTNTHAGKSGRAFLAGEQALANFTD